MTSTRLIGALVLGAGALAAAGIGAQTIASRPPSISGCGTQAIPRADRTNVAKLEAGIACFTQAAEIASAAAAERRALLPPAQAPTPTPGVAPSDWTRCAVEYGSCAVTALAEVRFGVDQRWLTRTVSAPIACTREGFGGDPAEGVVKSCEIRGASTPAAIDAAVARWQPRYRDAGFLVEVERASFSPAPDAPEWQALAVTVSRLPAAGEARGAEVLTDGLYAPAGSQLNELGALDARLQLLLGLLAG